MLHRSTFFLDMEGTAPTQPTGTNMNLTNLVDIDTLAEGNDQTRRDDRPTPASKKPSFENQFGNLGFSSIRYNSSQRNLPRSENVVRNEILFDTNFGPATIPRGGRGSHESSSSESDQTPNRPSHNLAQVSCGGRPRHSSPIRANDDAQVGRVLQELQDCKKLIGELLEENKRLQAEKDKSDTALRTLALSQSRQPDPSMQAPTTRSHRSDTQDIYVLKFKDMTKLNAPAMIQAFCRQVEHVGGDEDDRANIALAKMDMDLRLYVENQLDDRGVRKPTLSDVKDILINNFNRPKRACDAIDKLCNLPYDIEDCPRQYMYEFYRRYDEIRRAFPEETPRIPGRMWKNTVLKFAPREFGEELKNYTDEQCDEAFIQKLEKLRADYRYEARRNISALRPPIPALQQQLPATQQPMFPLQQPTYTPGLSGTRQWSQTSMKCFWCQDGSEHMRRDCPRQPAVNSCFDCLQPNSRKGHPGCPGFTGSRPPAAGQ